MPYINVDPNLPGIRSLMAFSPQTAEPMGKLANLMLRTNEGLTMAEREMIATYVSYLNDCFYCQQSHGAIVSCYLNDDNKLINQIKNDYEQAEIHRPDGAGQGLPARLHPASASPPPDRRSPAAKRYRPSPANAGGQRPR